MGQKTTKRVAQKRGKDKTLPLRQMTILQHLAMGEGVQQIATLMGVHRVTIYRAMKPILDADSEWQDIERNNIKSFLGMTNANIAMNLESGNLEAAKLVLKVLGFLTDRLELVAKIDPNDQQKKMIESMEALLKLSRDKVQGALPEMVKESKRVEAESRRVEAEDEGRDFKPDEENLIEVKQGETETMGMTKNQRACTCPADRDNPVNINLRCPVHGNKKQVEDKPKETEKPQYTAKGFRGVVEFEKKMEAEAQSRRERRSTPKPVPPGQGKPMEIRRLTKEEYEKALSGDEVSGEPKETETQSQQKPQCRLPTCPFPNNTDNCPGCVDMPIEKPRTKETESQSQRETCTCDFGHPATGDPVNVDPKCPVHGNQGGDTDPPGH